MVMDNASCFGSPDDRPVVTNVCSSVQVNTLMMELAAGRAVFIADHGPLKISLTTHDTKKEKKRGGGGGGAHSSQVHSNLFLPVA